MSYARSKNLTTYDVLIIASMIEREVEVPKERKLVAAVIYNRLHDGHAAPDRRDDPLRREQLHEAAHRPRPSARLPVQHLHELGPAAGADRQPGARLDPGGGSPGRTSSTSTTWSSPTPAASTPSPPPRPSSIAPRPPTTRPARRRAARRRLRRTARARDPRPGGWPSWASRSRTPARRRCTRRRSRSWAWPPSGPMRRSRSRPQDFEARVRGDAGRGVRGRERHRPAQGRARSRSPTRRPRRQRRSVPPTRSASPASGSPPRTPTPRASWTRWPSRPAASGRWSWARAARPSRRLGAGSGGASVEIWNRTAEKAERLAAELGRDGARYGRAGPRRRRLRPDRQRDHGRDGRRGEHTAGSQEPADRCRFVGRTDTNWWTWPMDRSTPSSSGSRGRGARRVVDGLEVLVRQGAASLRIWTGLDPPIETMRRAARSPDGNREPPRTSETRPRPGRGDRPPARRGPERPRR